MSMYTKENINTGRFALSFPSENQVMSRVFRINTYLFNCERSDENDDVGEN